MILLQIVLTQLFYRIIFFIISMTKLLDADWLRGVQLFHELYSCTINDFFKTNKMAKFKHKRNCSRGNKIAVENTNKAPNFG